MKKLLLVLVAALLAAGAAQAEPLKLRIHWATTPGHWAPLIAKFPNSVQIHYGKSYVVEPIFIAGSGPALQALAAGELELAGLSPQSIAIAINEANLPVSVIGQQFATDVPGWAGSSFWVRKGEIAKVEDLKGKLIGVNARGSTIDAAARTMLMKHGLEDVRDYQIVELRFPAQLAALKSRRVDLAILLRQWEGEAKKDPTITPLFSMGDALGPSETITWVGKADFVAKNRAALVDFIEDNIRARRWAASKEGHPEAVKIASEVTKRPVEQMEYAFTREDNFYEPNATVNVERLQKNIDDLLKIKLLEKSIDAKKHVDLSIAKEAAARVGPMTN